MPEPWRQKYVGAVLELRAAARGAIAALLLAAGGQALRADERTPFVLEAAPPAMARLYIFRAGAGGHLARESPRLQLDGKKVVELAAESYSSIAIEPGSHTLTLKPNEFEARSWNSAIKFDARPGHFYFLSIFKEYEPVGAARSIPPAQAFVPLISRPGHSVRAAGVSFEFVDQIEAVKVLPGLSYQRPGDPLPFVAP